MTGAINFLLFFSVLLAAVQGNILSANDVQSCTELCASCDGTSSFENGICKCFVPEDDTKGLECLMRLKRETDDLGLDTATDNPEAAERSARCSLLGSRRRIGSADADIVASYFMNGGPITGSPLLGNTNGACVPSSSEPLTGAVNPSNAKPPPVEPAVQKPVSPPSAKSPMVAAPSHPCPSSSSQYQPIVSSPWIPSHDAGYSSIIGSPQSYQPIYPQILSAIPQMVMALPNAVMRAASHIPSHNSGLPGSSQHSPLLASLASGTRSFLQRIDKMIEPHVSESNKIVGAPQQQASQCPYSNSKMLGAPSSAQGQAEPVEINASMLQQVLAQQNSLLEALSQQLESLNSPQVGAPRMQYSSPGHYLVGTPQQPLGQYAPQPLTQYAPQPLAQYAPQPLTQYAPQPLSQYSPQPLSQYAPQPVGQYTQQPMGQYAGQYATQPMIQYCPCPDGSPIVSSAKAPESPSKPAATLPQERDIVSAPNPSSSTSKVERNVSEKDQQDEKKTEENKKPQESESQKINRETRTRSSNRRKRGDVKYAKKKDTVVPEVKTSSTVS